MNDDVRAKLIDKIQAARCKWQIAYEKARSHPSPESLALVSEMREALDHAEDELHDFDFGAPTKS